MRADHIEIAPLGSGDLDSVSALYHAIWHETHAPLQDPRIAKSRDLAFFKSRLQRWKENTLVARIGVELAGFASWHGPALEALYIAPQFRSSGLGAKLLVAAESEMRKSGVSELSLDCVEGNNAARRFYERQGWRVNETIDSIDETAQGQIVVRHWVMLRH